MVKLKLMASNNPLCITVQLGAFLVRCDEMRFNGAGAPNFGIHLGIHLTLNKLKVKCIPKLKGFLPCCKPKKHSATLVRNAIELSF